MLKTVGGVLFVLGVMWALQGLGVLNWPASSFMLAQRQWAMYGGIMAVIGAAVVWIGMGLAAGRKR
ncbi:MAG: hypothetical protein NWP98_08750 [Erythrobacter sp.]|nr:hypothetical protein [Erythrobacter sp.]